MKNIQLQRVIEVRCWRVIGQVAKAAKRSELLPVLLRARERGATDAGDVAEHLLFESASRRVVGQRLLQIAELYGLLEQSDRRYRLTQAGEAALATKQVFVPEHGTWTVWASEDPLLAAPILRVEPWVEPHAGAEAPTRHADALEERRRRMKQLPSWMLPKAGQGLDVLQRRSDDTPLRIVQLEADGEAANPESTLRAVWDVPGNRLRVDGTLGGTHVNAAVEPPNIGADAVWMQLLQAEGLWSQWDASARALRVSFEDATAGERETLLRAVAFKRPDIAALGAFDATTVEGVAVRARSAQDATDWAKWRLDTRVRDYATAERFSAWTDEAVAPFSEFHPPVPTRQALADAAWRARTDRPTPQAWHLVAARDWSL